MPSKESINKVLCIGDCCADILIPYGQAKHNNNANIKISGGGTIANTAFGLAKLKVNCGYLGNCGNDFLGKKLKQELKDIGVNVDNFYLRDDISTPEVLVVIDENKDRFPFLMPKANFDQLYVYPEDLKDELLDEYQFILTSGFMFFDEGSKKALCAFLKKANQKGVKICLDTNLRIEQSNLDKTYLLEAIKYTNYLFVSVQDDLIPLTGIKEINSAANSLVTDNRIVIAKDGSNGSTVYTKDGIHHQDAFKVEVVDTLGAGDNFNAGFIYGLINNYSLQEANKIANKIASISITRQGARSCPSIEEI